MRLVPFTLLLALWPCSSIASASQKVRVDHSHRQDASAQPSGQQSDFKAADRLLNGAAPPPQSRRDAACQNNDGDKESDLCAQWTSANATRETADWTFWTLLVTVGGFIGLLYNLVLTRRATDLAQEAASLAGVVAADARKAVDAALKANVIALKSFEIAEKDLQDRMRPWSCVVGVRTLTDWQSLFDAGSPVPLVLDVENLGGSTARQLNISLHEVLVFDLNGEQLGRASIDLRMAPLRRSQLRHEGLLVRRFGHAIGKADRLVVSGFVGSTSDDKLKSAEKFRWITNPLNRRSGVLVERQPDGKSDDDGADGVASYADEGAMESLEAIALIKAASG